MIGGSWVVGVSSLLSPWIITAGTGERRSELLFTAQEKLEGFLHLPKDQLLPGVQIADAVVVEPLWASVEERQIGSTGGFFLQIADDGSILDELAKVIREHPDDHPTNLEVRLEWHGGLLSGPLLAPLVQVHQIGSRLDH